MRTIDLIVVHCTATKEGMPYTVKDVDSWHKARGFNCKGIHIGYHYLIYLDGSIHVGRPEEMVGAHCQDHNLHSIGVCYVGGLDSKGNPKDTRTTEQRSSLFSLLSSLKKKYPNAKIVSHHDLNPQKSCPCFPATREYSQLSNS